MRVGKGGRGTSIMHHAGPAVPTRSSSICRETSRGHGAKNAFAYLRAELRSILPLKVRADGYDPGAHAIEAVPVLIVHSALRRVANRCAAEVSTAHPGIGIDEAVVIRL